MKLRRRRRWDANWYWNEQAWGIHRTATRPGWMQIRQIQFNIGPLSITCISSVKEKP